MRRPLATGVPVLLVAAVLAFGCASQRAASGPTDALSIRATPVEIQPSELRGLRLRGAVALSAGHPEFGGLSGLLVEDGRMISVTDQGWLLEAALTDGPKGLRPGAARFVPLRNNGAVLARKSAGDAESLSRAPEGIAAGFERDHRIEFLDDDELGRAITDRRFERLGSNQGLEALATLPDGRLLAIAEAPRDGAFPVFVIAADGAIAEGRLPQVGRHFVTGADVGPDGRLYVLRRDFSLLLGVSIRIDRYRVGPDGFPVPQTRERLAAFEGSGIDNMEGIALWQDGSGTTRLTLISDDNFNLLQRTLLVDLELID